MIASQPGDIPLFPGWLTNPSSVRHQTWAAKVSDALNHACPGAITGTRWALFWASSLSLGLA
jgi:hypothetical protein